MEKIIQIIPAPRKMRAVCEEEGKYYASFVDCLGLTESGRTAALQLSQDGQFIDVSSCNNFVKLVRIDSDNPRHLLSERELVSTGIKKVEPLYIKAEYFEL